MDYNKTLENPFENSVDPYREMAAYEYMWSERNLSFKKIADFFKVNPGKISDNLGNEHLELIKLRLRDNFKKNIPIRRPKVVVKGTFDYPKRLLDAKEPLEVLYYEGDFTLLDNPKIIAVVGTRKPSEDGIKRTQQLVRQLVKEGFIIASGLAEGIDTVAHKTAIKYGGKTIAVLGTPLNHFYPKSNKDLQLELMKDHLVVSQVPYLRYEEQNYKINRFFFPERNKTMSALSLGTVIVEASETSGTLTQARAALYQKRKLFILNSCFENKKITWPERFKEIGAIKVSAMSDIFENING